jgi:hypothetical protein
MTLKDVIEEWIEMRAKLQKQVKALETGELQGESKSINAATQTTVSHIKNCIGELNNLLKEHPRVEGD